MGGWQKNKQKNNYINEWHRSYLEPSEINGKTCRNAVWFWGIASPLSTLQKRMGC